MMSLMARFDRKIFVTVLIVLIFMMTNNTLTLLRKLRTIKVEIKAVNVAAPAVKLMIWCISFSSLQFTVRGVFWVVLVRHMAICGIVFA